MLFLAHSLAEIYLDSELNQFRPFISMCVSAFKQNKIMILKVVFSNTIVLCLVFLQTFTFFLLSFSTVICYFMIFVIILNSWKLLEVSCGV